MTDAETPHDDVVNVDDVQGRRAQANSPGRPPRKFVLFADGTGNAFTRQESNVWRLYEALDRTKPDQVAYYIKGVGTAGWAPFAALDGATGIGVPSNVRKLYRFLCWNWEPGDEIHIFGFSRGAFTARTLAGLIASQGLVPAEIDGAPVSHAEMERNAMMAWRAYREHSVPMRKSLPTIWIARWIRNFVLWLYHLVMRHRSYQQVKAAMGGRHKIEIAFLGMFDTVEAYGVPIEEIRTAIDWAIWPISFRNRKLAPTVLRACHALALDDERVTFHPIRFDHPDGDTRVTEVWFSGMHSDVGGGYPDGTLSYMPLVWMVGQIGHRLRFQPGAIDHFRDYQSAIGPLHDSRSGAAVLYRYGPRPIGEDEKIDGGPPIIHFGVVERMLHGCDNYAPVTLPASARVMLPSGKVMELTERPHGGVRKLKAETQQEMQSVYLESRKAKNERGEETAAGLAAADVFTKMKVPDDNMVQQTLDTVWWRRFWYFFLLAAVAFLAAWPLVGPPIVIFLKGPTSKVIVSDGKSILDLIRIFDYAAAAVVGPLAHFLEAFLPSYAEPWLKIALFYPFATLVVVAVVGLAWSMNSFLRDRIQERARLAWNRPHRLVADIGKPTWLLEIGRVMRLKAGWLQKAVAVYLVPAIFLLAFYGAAALAVGRSYFAGRDGTAGFKWTWLPQPFCNATEGPIIVDDKALSGKSPFATSNPCWASGLWVEKDRKYRISIAIKDPWFDRTIMTGVNGFQLNTARQLAGLPLRRWYGAAWFQPIARIGANADAELPLQPIDGALPDKLPRQRDPRQDSTDLEDGDTYPVRVEDNTPAQPWPAFGWFEPIPESALPAAREVWRQQRLPSLMVADFTATASGELFLYVNDAIQLAPFFGPFDLFYKNNSGTAEVTVQRMPLQPAKQ